VVGGSVRCIYKTGAGTDGFAGEVWTTKRQAALIRTEFGVRYHPAQVSRLVRELGWSLQKPVRQATQRDEAAIQAWREERWPALEKRRRTRSVRWSG